MLRNRQENKNCVTRHADIAAHKTQILRHTRRSNTIQFGNVPFCFNFSAVRNIDFASDAWEASALPCKTAPYLKSLVGFAVPITHAQPSNINDAF